MATPVSVKAHHCQFPATPCVRTKFATRFGVSLENVVATMDIPASHHGTDRPDAKNSAVLLPDRLLKNSAGRKHIKTIPMAIAQSSGCSVMRFQTGARSRTLQDYN